MKENEYGSREEFKDAICDMERQQDLKLSARILMNQQKEKRLGDKSRHSNIPLVRRKLEGRLSDQRLDQDNACLAGNAIKKKNGFLLAEALIALLICSISGFLVLMSSSALAKAMSMDIQTEMNLEADLSVDSEQ